MENVNWTLVILLTTVGFFTLAAILLLPVYFFLKGEERISKLWTPEALAKQQRENRGGRAASPPNAPAAPGPASFDAPPAEDPPSEEPPAEDLPAEDPSAEA